MISSLLLLPLLMQSATPYGSPIDPVLRPSATRPEAKAAAKAPAPRAKTPSDVRWDQCVDQAVDDPAAGLLAANRWQLEGGGYLARNCLGFAYAESEDWAKAVPEFVQAAEAAQAAGDERAANFWSQAGNAALAKGDADLALTYLAAALALDSPDGLLKGEVHLDQARALVSLERYDEAKAEFAAVHQLVPEDPLGWLLSATLARRMGDLERAKADIAAAAKLVATDPAIALEAGNIAYEAGDMANAKANWEQAVKFDPDSASAKAASRYLAQLDSAVAE
ncbi:tetratricopeptide repeat protein [Parasphingorhabdus sp.]|uniref:tetratricopeptide repeat protein n=1 Tax=Parasphingorhabdus sp. TaxID=2709688 RepID=UPI00300149A4